MMLWAGLCASIAFAFHKITVSWAAREGSYRTGVITLSVFLLAFSYPLRKYSVWLSLRWVRLVSRLPQRWSGPLMLWDRLETWRVMHVTFGVLVLLPFWWHTQFGRRSLLELALETTLILLVLSGFFGTIIEDFLPAKMLKIGNQAVRLEDVEAASHSLYVQAEELVLGHSEQLIKAYLSSVRPILAGSQPSRTLLWATLTGTHPAGVLCRAARRLTAEFGSEGPVFGELVDLAERKIGLDHNQFNLKLGIAWLRLHRRLSISALTLVIFHVTGALYFAGI
jgi:hypothetical protein